MGNKSRQLKKGDGKSVFKGVGPCPSCGTQAWGDGTNPIAEYDLDRDMTVAWRCRYCGSRWDRFSLARLPPAKPERREPEATPDAKEQCENRRVFISEREAREENKRAFDEAEADANAKRYAESAANAICGRHNTDRSLLLAEADALINGDRQRDYGPPEENMARIAIGWSVIFKCDITSAQVAMAMAWVKIARLCQDQTVRDGWRDMAGYAGIGAEMVKDAHPAYVEPKPYP